MYTASNCIKLGRVKVLEMKFMEVRFSAHWKSSISMTRRLVRVDFDGGLSGGFGKAISMDPKPQYHSFLCNDNQDFYKALLIKGVKLKKMILSKVKSEL